MTLSTTSILFTENWKFIRMLLRTRVNMVYAVISDLSEVTNQFIVEQVQFLKKHAFDRSPEKRINLVEGHRFSLTLFHSFSYVSTLEGWGDIICFSPCVRLSVRHKILSTL